MPPEKNIGSFTVCGKHQNYKAGTPLYDVRKEADMSQRELANQIGVDNTMISLWETGKRKIPLDKAAKLAELFELELADIIGPGNVTVCTTLDKALEMAESMGRPVEDLFTIQSA